MGTQRSLDELIARAEANLTSATGQNNPATKGIAAAIAGVSYGQYGYQDLLFRQLHPETCSEEWLYLHANRHKAGNFAHHMQQANVGTIKLRNLLDEVVQQ